MNVDEITWKLTKLPPQETMEKLSLGQDVLITIKGSVVQEIVGDNQDGSVNLCYVVKPMVTELSSDKNV